MMSIQSLLNHLEGLVREEIESKKRLLVLLERQERAVLEQRRADLDETTQAIEKELFADVARAGRRERIFSGLAAHWSVAPGTLTLASIAERADRIGHAGNSLLALRGEMREMLATVLRKNRRVGRLVHEHRRLVADTLTLIVGGGNVGDEDVLERSGALVDAEA